jgi:hypothetical protein
LISVVVPTIAGRERHLETCLRAYKENTAGEYEAIVIEDRPACGVAWVDGMSTARGDFVHFSADDLSPHEGWDVAAREVVGRGFLPAPRILNDDNTLQSCGGSDGWETDHPTGYQTDFSRIPFLSRQLWNDIRVQVEPFLRETHYFTDNCISYAAAKHGIATGVHNDYLFTHSLAEAGRGAGMTWEQRMWADRAKFDQWALWLSGA